MLKEKLIEGRPETGALQMMMCQNLLSLLMSPHAASDGVVQVVRTQTRGTPDVQAQTRAE